MEWIREGVQMKQIVNKFQCVRMIFDSSARFLRDTCFNLWKSIFTRSEYYRVFAIKKHLKYCFNKFRHNGRKAKMLHDEEFTEELDSRMQKLNELQELIAKHNTVSAIVFLYFDMCLYCVFVARHGCFY